MVIHALKGASSLTRAPVTAASPPPDGYAGAAPARSSVPPPGPSPAWALAGLAYESDARKLQQRPHWEQLPLTEIALGVLNATNTRQVLQQLNTERSRWALELIEQREQDSEGNDHLKLRADRERVAIARAVLQDKPVLAGLEDVTPGLLARLVERLGDAPALKVARELQNLVQHPVARMGLEEAALVRPDCTDEAELIALALPRCGSQDGIALGRRSVHGHEETVRILREACVSQEMRDWSERSFYVAVARGGTREEVALAALPAVVRSPELLRRFLSELSDHPVGQTLGEILPEMGDLKSRKRLVETALAQPLDSARARLGLLAGATRAGGPDRALLEKGWERALTEVASEVADYPSLGKLASDSWGCPVLGAVALVERGIALSSGPLTEGLRTELAQLQSEQPEPERALAHLRDLGERQAELSRQAEPGNGIRVQPTHVEVGGVRLGRK